MCTCMVRPVQSTNWTAGSNHYVQTSVGSNHYVQTIATYRNWGFITDIISLNIRHLDEMISAMHGLKLLER